MNIRKSKEGKYTVESEHRKGTFYTVDPDKPFCTCAQYRFRGIKSHTLCKHITTVREKIAGQQQPKYDQVIAELRKGQVSTDKLCRKYGDRIIEELKRRGEIFEEKGVARILE